MKAGFAACERVQAGCSLFLMTAAACLVMDVCFKASSAQP